MNRNKSITETLAAIGCLLVMRKLIELDCEHLGLLKEKVSKIGNTKEGNMQKENNSKIIKVGYMEYSHAIEPPKFQPLCVPFVAAQILRREAGKVDWDVYSEKRFKIFFKSEAEAYRDARIWINEQMAYIQDYVYEPK